MNGMKPEEIRAELILRKIKITDIAARIGVTQEAVSRVIKGVTVSQKIRKELAVILGKPVLAIWPDKAA